MKGSTAACRLKEYINTLKIYDTHEHLIPPQIRSKKKEDIFSVLFSGYAGCDLISSGMSQRDFSVLVGEEADLDTKWALLSPYLDFIKLTGYYRAVKRTLRCLFGADDINKENYAELDAARKNGYGVKNDRQLLQEKGNIILCIQDNLFKTCEYATDFVRPAFNINNLNPFTAVSRRDDLKEFEREAQKSLESLSAFEQYFEEQVHLYQERGGIALKDAIAYERTLYFENTDYSCAEAAYQKLYRGQSLPEPEIRRLQDYLTHQAIKFAIDCHLPIQIHTGMFGGNGKESRLLSNSNPVHLNNLFSKYPQAKFDIFHGAYPYCGELAALAKNFPNVHINLCWMQTISPHAARYWLNEWLDTVPANKLFAFGGDCGYPEEVLGSCEVAKENVAAALAERMDAMELSEPEAQRIAEFLFYGNAAHFYGAV